MGEATALVLRRAFDGLFVRVTAKIRTDDEIRAIGTRRYVLIVSTGQPLHRMLTTLRCDDPTITKCSTAMAAMAPATIELRPFPRPGRRFCSEALWQIARAKGG